MVTLNLRRYKVKITGKPNKDCWFSDMVGEEIIIRFVKYACKDYELYGINSVGQYIKPKFFELLDTGKINESNIKDHNEPTCAHFGCSNKLTTYGNLFNNRCIEHQIVKKTNIMDVLRLK